MLDTLQQMEQDLGFDYEAERINDSLINITVLKDNKPFKVFQVNPFSEYIRELGEAENYSALEHREKYFIFDNVLDLALELMEG